MSKRRISHGWTRINTDKNICEHPWLIIGYNFLYKSKLYKKIHGCEAAAATASMTYQQIDEK